MRRTFLLSTLCLFASSALSVVGFAAEVPRTSAEFVLNLNGGKQELLSSHRGKVCLVEFLFTTCPHCQHTAKTLNTLQAQYGPRGFQAIGIAFNEMSNMLIPDFVRDHGVKFPVAWANRDPVLNYLQISPMERFVVPMIVIIDKKGKVRHQSPPNGDPKLQEEANLRVIIEGLLKEGGAPATSASAAGSGSGSGAGAARKK